MVALTNVSLQPSDRTALHVIIAPLVFLSHICSPQYKLGYVFTLITNSDLMHHFVLSLYNKQLFLPKKNSSFGNPGKTNILGQLIIVLFYYTTSFHSIKHVLLKTFKAWQQTYKYISHLSLDRQEIKSKNVTFSSFALCKALILKTVWK